MTISSQTRKAGPTDGNGVATSFPFAFKVFEAADLVVTLATLSTGAESTLTLNTDYTVSLNADQDASPGGSITYNPTSGPLTALYSLTISSAVSPLQESNLTSGGAFLPQVIEDMADRSIICVQQLTELQTRSLVFPVSDPTANSSGVIPAWQQRAGMLLSFDANGIPQVVAPASQSATALATLLASVNGASSIGYGALTLYQYLTALDTTLANLATWQVNPTGILSLNGASLRGRSAPYLVNGGAEIAQVATTVTLTTAAKYGQVDNVALWASGGAVSAGTLTQNTAATVGRTGYAARAAGVTLTGAGVLSWRYRVESIDAIELKNKNGSFQIAVMHDVGAPVNYTTIIRKPTASDNYTGVTVIATSAATAVASATPTVLQFQAQALGDVSNGIEIEVQAACGAVVTKNFDFTEWQLEEGNYCTAFVRPDFNNELRRCWRYLPYYAATTSSEAICPGLASGATLALLGFKFEVPPRIAPTGITTTGSFNVLTSTAGLQAVTSLTYGGSSTGLKLGGLNATVAAGIAAGNATALYAATLGASIKWNGCQL